MKTRKGWRLVVALAGCLAVLAFSACEDDSDANGGGGGGSDTAGGTTDTGGGGNTDTGGGGTDFPAGSFQLTTVNVDDDCLDQALAILFQPGGVGTPYDLEYPTEFPDYGELPKTFTMRLQAPFSDMQVTMEAAGADRMTVTDSVQTDLVVDAANYGDCNVDMRIDADVIIVDTDHITVAATVEVSDWTSATDTCPNVTSDPCTIALDLTGRRL